LVLAITSPSSCDGKGGKNKKALRTVFSVGAPFLLADRPIWVSRFPLRGLFCLLYIETDTLTLVERLESTGLDSAIMYEYIAAFIFS
jgi:hypothetical protein